LIGIITTPCCWDYICLVLTANSYSISGEGLAQAKTIGFSDIFKSIFTVRETEKISAPLIAYSKVFRDASTANYCFSLVKSFLELCPLLYNIIMFSQVFNKF